MAKVQQLPVPPRPVVEEEEAECPRCPPVGAPAWMATFADIATLLMAFFVLILGFANFDEPSFKKMAGSMREAFGTQMVNPALKEPENATILELNSRPAANPPNVDPNEEPATRDAGPSASETSTNSGADTEAVLEALKEAMANGELKVESSEGSVTVKLPPGAGPGAAEALAEALATAAGTQPGPSPQAEPATGTPDAEGKGATEAGEGQGEGSGAEGKHDAAIADARLRVALRQEMGEGLVNVETRDDKVFVTVGAGGAFPSGSADLTEKARDVMARLALSAATGESRVTVTGHTDSVPLNGDTPFRDNWGLAAARAASVVRELGGEGFDPARLTAVSRGESLPVADNATAEGREKNRRIEIEISYGSE